MRLIGMLDSPYVRRVAISLQLQGLPFTHEPLSVFRTFDAFSRINPVVKAPTLVTDDGVVLMDSTFILQHAASLPGSRRSLMPAAGAPHTQALRTIGLALAACEKAVQILYEQVTRPVEKAHEPWARRVTGQLTAALRELDTELARLPLDCTRGGIQQAAVSSAVAWHFTQRLFPELALAALHPALEHLSVQAECLPEFIAAPHGEGTYQPRR